MSKRVAEAGAIAAGSRMGRTTQLLSDLYGVKPPEATALSPLAEQIAEAVRTSPVAHFDETGQRTCGRRQRFHTAATAKLTWYGTHDKRSAP